MLVDSPERQKSYLVTTRTKLNEYSGQAMSYQVLAEYAPLGIGAAILPKSKIPDTDSKRTAYMITDESGSYVTIQFQTIWNKQDIQIPHLNVFREHLEKVAPSIVDGLQSNY